MDSFTTSLLPFPSGDNSSDTLIDGRHWNITALQHFGPWDNLTVFSDNGTFYNSTSCYTPILPLGSRSKISLGFAPVFMVALILAVANLAKHGKEHINPRVKRFSAFRRRFQWVWMFVAAASGLVCSFTTIDVDRYYLPETPFIIMSIFYFLMLPSTLALVWECAWHWGSWLERKAIEQDPWSLTKDHPRKKVDVWPPFVFYFLIAANAALLIPRSWANITKQRDAQQTQAIAQAAATDLRFKIGAFLNLAAWLTILFTTLNFVSRYRPHSQEIMKLFLSIPLALLMVGYEAACAFVFDISPLQYHNPNLGIIYGLGWVVIVLILLIQGIYGIKEPNDDEEIKRLRKVKLVRGRAAPRNDSKPSTEEDVE